MLKRRVVITGLGPVSGFGIGMDALWAGMLEGRSSIGRVRRFDPTPYPCQFAAQLDDDALDIRKIVPKSYRKATKVMCRDIELAVAAAAAAVEDAGLVTKATDPDAAPTIPSHRLGCHIGAGLIAADTNELTAALITSSRPGTNGSPEFDLAHWGHTGMNNLTPLWLLKYLPNMLACHVTIIHGCTGPSNTITCCEASSGLSLGESARVIDRGDADACLTGGAEDKLNPTAYLRQSYTTRVAQTEASEDPHAIVRPFDPEARGCVLGEGGAILVAEALDSAVARGARLYAEVLSASSTQSFCPDTIGLDPDPEDLGISNVMRLALEYAGLATDQVDAIVPFGSSIPSVDAAEATAIRRVFGSRASGLPVITTAPNVGNCFAGNGAIGLAVAARALKEQCLPARLNTRGAEGLDAAACPTRDAKLEHILVFTTSQGGQNSAVVLKRIEEAS